MIDSHQHFWIYNQHRDAWITDNMAIIQRDFLPNDLQPILEKQGFSGCVAVQADQSVDETYFLLECADQYDFVKGVVGWIDLRAENIDEQIANLSSYKKLKGFRHVIQAEPDENFMLRPDFQAGIVALGDAGYTYDLLIYPNHLPVANRFVSLFSDQPIVLDHIAKPYIKQGLIDKWKQDISTLAQHENLFCKISGIVTEADWKNWKKEQIIPYLDVVFEAFGTNRLMFGSDWPVCLLASPYEGVVGLIGDYIEKLSDSEKYKIMTQNATDFYGLS
jgi:L-fuconolactonase